MNGKISHTNFYEFIDKFILLPDPIRTFSRESFDLVMRSKEAKEHSNVVYIWRTERCFQRLKGESDVIYIGQTKHSFSRRYVNFGQHISSKANHLKLSHIIESYGAISISVYDFRNLCGTLQEAEGQLLWWYFQNHCEYPPLNYTKTNIRNDEVII